MTYVPYSMGRMEYNWGPDAASFKPERWLKDGVFQNASPFKFTAFQVIKYYELFSLSFFLIRIATILDGTNRILCRRGRGSA